MRALALALSVLIASCGGGESSQAPAPNNHGYGFHFDKQGQRGLKLRYHEDLTWQVPPHQFTDPNFFEGIFDAVQKCTGLNAPMLPFLIVVHPDEIAPDGGFFYSSPYLVVMATGVRAYRHEVVHYLLHYNTGNAGGHVENGVFVHTSPLFAQCEGG